MRRRLAAAAFASALVLLAAPVAPGAPAAAQQAPARAPRPAGAPGISAASAILVDLDDGGRVLFGRATGQVRAPASLTKVVTALVVRDEYALDEAVTITDKVNVVGGSSLGLREGMRYPVRDLLYALLLKSANDAATALADHHPLGYEYFVRLMNQKARALGAYRSSFRNPHGLDQPGHVSTAWDMAIFGRQVLADPVLATYVSTARHVMTWQDGTRRIFTNHNKLLTTRRYAGAIGVKTGYTDDAGHSLIGAVAAPNGKLLTVVLGSKTPGTYPDTVALFQHGKELQARSAAGGGPEQSTLLPKPPDVPVVPGLSGALAREGDPRDAAWWIWMMTALAVITGLTLVRWRRSDPLREAAAFHGWLDPIVDPRIPRRSS